jgi:NAD/NADP transhydrogenase beta subunit
MNPFKLVTRPVKNITDAIVMPFRALFVVGLTGLINAMTYHGVWWFKWVALGMGIAVVVSLARAAKTLLLLALVAWVGMKIYQRYGASARARFDDWVATAQPQAAQVLQALRGTAAGAGPSSSTAGPGTA